MVAQEATITTRYLCQLCGWTPRNPDLSEGYKLQAFRIHVARCAEATDRERNYFKARGKWPQREGWLDLNKPRVVPVFKPKPTEKTTRPIQYAAWIRDTQGKDTYVAIAENHDAIPVMASHVAKRMLEGGHAGMIILAPGVQRILPSESAGFHIQLGKGGHWERVQHGGGKQKPSKLSRRENAELWMEETRLQQDRLRCVEDAVLLYLRAHVGKWLPEEELMKIPNTTLQEIMDALRSLKTYGLVDNKGSMWRPLL